MIDKYLVSGTRIRLHSGANTHLHVRFKVTDVTDNGMRLERASECFTPKIVPLIDACDYGSIVTDFYLFIWSEDDECVCLRQALIVRFDDGDQDVWYGALAHRAFEVVSYPEDFDFQIENQKHRKDKLLDMIADGTVNKSNYKLYNHKNENHH